MSYNARVRAKQNRAGGLYGCDRGWEVGSDQSGAIGIPYKLRRQISNRTRPICYINGVKIDDRNLVVLQNQLQRGGGPSIGGAYGPSARGLRDAPKRFYWKRPDPLC